MEARLSGLRSRFLGNSNGGVLLRLPMECTLKTLRSLLCSSGAVGSFVRAAANMRWGDSLPPLKERTWFCSHCVSLCSTSTRRRGWVVSVFACRSRDVDSILSSVEFFFPSFLRGHVTKVRLRTPISNFFSQSVAKWLALFSYHWCV